jgi:hypothetical protein
VVEVTGLPPLPTGQPVVPALFVFKPGTAAAGAMSAVFTMTAPLNAPEGKRAELLIQGKAKINNVDKIVTGPTVTLTVLRPFTVDLATPSLTIQPGQTATLKVKLLRQSVFKEAVQISLGALPKGVTLGAPLKPVAGNQNEFQIDLKVDPKAVAVMANLTVTCSTTIAGMAYSHPVVTVPVKVVVK